MTHIATGTNMNVPVMTIFSAAPNVRMDVLCHEARRAMRNEGCGNLHLLTIDGVRVPRCFEYGG